MVASRPVATPALDVALVTWTALPDGDPDDRALLLALRARGVAAAYVPWDDAATDWPGVRLAVLRSPWNYTWTTADFLAWCDRAAATTTLWNPPGLVRWNAHKGYLRDLAAARVPVVPTEHLAAGGRVDLAALLAARGWRDAVLKPAIGAGARDTHRIAAGNGAGQANVDRLLPTRDLLVQPWLDSVATHGERCYVFLDGTFSHVVRKRPPLDQPAVEADPAAPESDERAVADAALAAIAARGHRWLYARVDLLRDTAGRPCVSEIEVIEPTLFFSCAPGAAARMAAAIIARVPSR